MPTLLWCMCCAIPAGCGLRSRADGFFLAPFGSLASSGLLMARLPISVFLSVAPATRSFAIVLDIKVSVVTPVAEAMK